MIKLKLKVPENSLPRSILMIWKLASQLRLIADELQKYPEIGLEWKEPGMAFRVTFVKKNYVVPISRDENDQVSDQVISILGFCSTPKSRGEILKNLGYKNHFDNYKRYLEPVLNNYLIEMTIPDKPKSKDQKYRLTDRGKQTLEMIRRNNLSPRTPSTPRKEEKQ